MRIRELRDGLEVEEDERAEEASGGEVVAVVRLKAKRALVGAGARFLFYPTLLYNVVRNRFEAEFRWWDRVDQYVLLGAVPFPSDVPRLKQLGVRGVVTLNEPYETLVPTSLYQSHGINHLEIPTRDYLFAPSLEHICQAVDFIHRFLELLCEASTENEMQGGSTYVHCKAGRGRSTTIVLCFLIKYRNMTPEAALDHARSAVKTFSTLNTTHDTRCLSIQSSNPTCPALSYEESSEHFGTLTSRCLSIQSSDEDSSVTSDEESSEASVTDPEIDGYTTTEFDSEHFVLPRCRSMLSRPTSPTGCSDLVFITEADLEGYESFTDVGEDDVEDGVEVVVRHKPIMRKLSCFLGSLKLTSNCEPPPNRLTEVRAC
ncbi:putative dual specificity protein phosphatase DSP8 [Panicum miliaceum]|uniref:phosphatidylglycerophosphatase n=1 Tax=Panicum miliaceum TaxID=4540 RepID=A0A3L6REJ6_PANMI|nr:putative dual specificity protein phosphatase DSP8 [Panicum miliaceum]